MLRVPHYRAWIYIINLILIQLICLISANPRLQLFPVEEVYALILFLFVSIALQLLVSICGILGVYFSNEHVIRLTWLLQVPMVIFDVIQAVLWAISFANLHQEYEKTLTTAIQHVVASNMHTSYNHVCHYWKNLQTELRCCAPATVAMSCQDLTCPKQAIMCHYALLQWLHTNTDLLASVIYFVLLPLKLIILVMLRFCTCTIDKYIDTG
ncbi:hypothetical protein M3Y96_00241000 [Aphelenchoides besseyi]|nr:hypothetical protein M3Y96_00241000 [Aphelenchoides besseyi]